MSSLNSYCWQEWETFPKALQRKKLKNHCPRRLAGISIINFWYFGRNFRTRNARKSMKHSEDLYYSLVSNKNLSQKNGYLHSVGVQGLMTSSECKQNIHKLCQHQQKPDIKNWNNFFFITNYQTFPIFEGFEQLSSSIDWRVTAFSKKQPRLAFVRLHFLSNFWFLSHKFDPRYVRRPIKGSKDSDHSLVSKKLEQKMTWYGGPGNLGQKGKNMPPLWHHPQKTPNSKRKKFFKNLN